MQRLPNRMTITKVLIDGYPSKPFTMQLIPPMGKYNEMLADAVKRLSLAKYGRPRAEVEAEIQQRLRGPVQEEENKKEQLEHLKAMSYGGRTQTAEPVGPVARPEISTGVPPTQGGGGGSAFLDDWLAKRSQIQTQPATAPAPEPQPVPVVEQPAQPQPAPQAQPMPQLQPVAPTPIQMNAPQNVVNPTTNSDQPIQPAPVTPVQPVASAAPQLQPAPQPQSAPAPAPTPPPEDDDGELKIMR